MLVPFSCLYYFYTMLVVQLNHLFPVSFSQKDTRGVISTRVLKHNMQGTLEHTTAVMCSDVT